MRRFYMTVMVMVAMSVVMSARPARAEDQAQPAKTVKYVDDFKDPKKVEADSDAMNNVKVFPGIGLSSENGNPGYVLWDIDKLIPTRVADAKITLIYSGAAVGPDGQRGVTWFSSTDGKEWTEISTNKFDTPVDFQGKYLKASLRWIQAATADYGLVNKFSLKTAAK